MNPAHSPMVRIVTQRSEGDCGICALAMFLEMSYEDVFAAAVTETHSRRLHHSGMYSRQIKGTAAALGVRLRQRRKWDMETDTGLVILWFNRQSSHVALLKCGLIFDTDGTVWEPDAYCIAFNAVPKALYVVDDDSREDQ
jgi:hypothetical protein